MFELELSELADKKFSKLSRKNKEQLKIIEKKINQILSNPRRFKNLRGDMKGAKRVHIDNHFVLVFEVNYKKNLVKILDYDHHDKIY